MIATTVLDVKEEPVAPDPLTLEKFSQSQRVDMFC